MHKHDHSVSNLHYTLLFVYTTQLVKNAHFRVILQQNTRNISNIRDKSEILLSPLSRVLCQSPQYLFLFTFLCKSFRSCIIYNFMFALTHYFFSFLLVTKVLSKVLLFIYRKVFTYRVRREP